MPMRFPSLLVAVALLAGSAHAQTANMVLESKRAKQLMAERRFADAAPLYEKLVRAMPDNTGLRLNLAMALHLSGQDAKAIPEFESVLRQQPRTLPALMLLGASYLRTNSPAKAVAPLEKALTMAPDDLEGRAMLADALLQTARYGAALPHLKKLAQAAPDEARVWYRLGRCYESVAQQAFESLQKLGEDSPWWLALAADVRVKEGKNTAAFVLYRTVLDKQPSFRGAHAGLAQVYRNTNHAEWAAQEDERERKLPALACAVPSAACSYEKADYEQALRLAQAKTTPEALYVQSRAANQLAAAAFTQLTKLPRSVEFYQFTGEFYRNQQRWAEAIEAWQGAIRMEPDDNDLKQELAATVYMSRDYVKAEALAREFLLREPASADLLFILGDALMNQQRPEEALVPLTKAIELRKSYPPAQATLGRALLQLDRASDAIPHLKAALSADTDGSLYFQLSRAYQITGQQDLADATRKTYQEIRRASSATDIAITAPDK